MEVGWGRMTVATPFLSLSPLMVSIGAEVTRAAVVVMVVVVVVMVMVVVVVVVAVVLRMVVLEWTVDGGVGKGGMRVAMSSSSLSPLPTIVGAEVVTMKMVVVVGRGRCSLCR